MQRFTTLTGIAAPLPIANIDTDMILSAKFLKTVSRVGLGVGLFDALRRDRNGLARRDFVLNREPWQQANILIALDNFGCGSSREHAPWALLDFGIRCVIAPSFADIFYGNCFKNGILPIHLDHAEVDRLMTVTANPATATLTVDLEALTIADHSGSIAFKIDAARRERLLQGVDDITQSLAFEHAITAHERETAIKTPWLADARLARS